MKRIYVAGPLTNGDMLKNVRAAMRCADILLDLGFEPYLPHLTYYLHQEYPHDYERWMQLCLAWLSVCDALVRMPGFSLGANREEAFAVGHDIPVFHTIADLVKAAAQ